MGFYHAATVVNDARRHGVRVLPVDVTRSDWLCTLESDDGERSHDRLSQATHASSRSRRPIQQWVVRLGLRYVKGLREAAGRALVAARAERPFASARDLVTRAELARDEMQTLAAIGALAALGGTRRANIWTTAEPDFGPLFAEAPSEPPPSPLREMTTMERLVADYGGTGVTLGPHPMALRRAELVARGVRRACELSTGRDGERVRVAGSVIVRQRPGTAKGFVFLSLEDETGIANVIVTPRLFARQRWALVAEPFLLAEGILQIQDGVISVRAARVEPLWRLEHTVPSHDFG
jgi:error-prone DNA polymerase